MQNPEKWGLFFFPSFYLGVVGIFTDMPIKAAIQDSFQDHARKKKKERKKEKKRKFRKQLKD